MESTYGNRLHEDEELPLDKLQRIISQTSKAGGNVIIPTFALERAQELLYCINSLLREDRIPRLVVFMDSPMAIHVTEVFRKHTGYLDKETRRLIEQGESPFDFPLLKTTRTVA